MSHLWSEIRDELRQQLGDDAFTRHFARVSGRDAGRGVLALTAADEVTSLIIQRDYKTMIERIAGAIRGNKVTLTVDVGDAAEAGSGGLAAPSEPQLSLFDAPVASAMATDKLAPGEQVALLAPRPAARDGRRSARERAASEAGQMSIGAPTPTSASLGQRAPTYEEQVMRCGLARSCDFDSFVVGSSNEFAAKAARAAAENLGALYNPLFLFGGVGLGKTHLLHALGLAALRDDPRRRVRYLSAETFVNELIESIGAGRMEAFRRKNRVEVDVLLLDDIQFIAGKDRTQAEFFHTFNALHQAGKQIVVTSDRFPQEMPDLEERLKSRLSMGLIADIQPPDLETRIVILQNKAASLGIHVPQDVVHYVAETVRSNVRELHGALIRIGSYARHRGAPLTLEIAQEHLGHLLQEDARRITPELILELTCAHYGVREDEIKGRRRLARIAEPRKVAMFLCKKWTQSSYPELGRFFGDRDHTTVLSACKNVEKRLDDKPEMRAALEAIERRLRRV